MNVDTVHDVNFYAIKPNDIRKMYAHCSATYLVSLSVIQHYRLNALKSITETYRYVNSNRALIHNKALKMRSISYASIDTYTACSIGKLSLKI